MDGPYKVRWKSLSKPLAHSQHFRLIKLYACMIILHHKSWGDVIKLKIWLSWANKLNFSWTTWCGALSVVALKKWFRNLHLLNIHVMLLGQEGRLAAIDTVQEFLCELDMKPNMDLVKKIILSLSLVRLSKIMINLVKRFQNSDIQSNFSVSKISKKIEMEILDLKTNFYLHVFFKLSFLKYFIF